MSKWECGRGPRAAAAEAAAAVLARGETSEARARWKPYRETAASRGSLLRAAFRFCDARGFCAKRGREKLPRIWAFGRGFCFWRPEAA